MASSRLERRAGLIAAAVVLLVASASGADAPDALLADPADAGLGALDAGDYALALPLLERAAEIEPDDAFLHYALGVAAVQLGRDVVASRALRRAAALDPELPGVQAELGLALARLDDDEGAERHLLEALLQGPEDPDVLLQLGVLDAKRGRFDRAIRYFEDAAIVDPSFAAVAWYEAAGVALDRGDLEAAIAYLERASVASGSVAVRERAAELLAALRPAPPRRIELSAGAGIEYDDNLTVVVADAVTGRSDVAGVFDGSIGLYAVRRPDLQLSVGYDFFQSVYAETSPLDLQSHSPYVALAAGEGRLVGLASYRYATDTLGGSGFMSTHRGDIEAELTITSWLWATLGTRVEGMAFDQSPARDAQRISLGIGASVSGPADGVSLEFGWRPVWTDARGPEFDYRGDVVSTSLYFSLPLSPDRRVDLRLGHDWEGRDYDHDDPLIGARRRDSRHLFGAGASMLLMGPTEIGLDYLHVSSSSNIPELNYGENIATLRLGAFY